MGLSHVLFARTPTPNRCRDELASQGNFLSLDNRIEHFRRSLSRIDPSRTDTVRTVLLTHTLAQYASIQLHTPLVQDRVTANSRTYEAAHAAVENLRSVSPPGFVNPLMAVSGPWICLTIDLLRESGYSSVCSVVLGSSGRLDILAVPRLTARCHCRSFGALWRRCSRKQPRRAGGCALRARARANISQPTSTRSAASSTELWQPWRPVRVCRR